jgi:hypothetical protein
MPSNEPTYVFRIACGDDRGVELESGGDNKGVNSVSGGHTRFGEQKTRSLGNWPSKVKDQDAAVVEETVDGGIEARTPADFAKDGCWDANESAALMREREDGPSSVLKDGALRGTCQGVDGLRIED